MKIFATVPPSSASSGLDFARHVSEVAQWSEHAGCEGVLIYTDNSLIDPWLVADTVVRSTSRLCPLVAVQPAYMHPYSVAKLVSSFGYLYGRRVYLNMVAGGFKNDLAALHDLTPHDQRYARLIEYTTIIQELLRSPSPLTYQGEYYTVEKLAMTPPLKAELFPGVLVSGSSEAGLAAARVLGATAIQYPQPVNEIVPDPCHAESGIRLGIIARETDDEAWRVANDRFPEDRRGQLTHQLAMKTSDSSWHRQLSDEAPEKSDSRSPYWLRPFQNYKTFCPYLVGSYDRVAEEVRKYLDRGYSTLILDVPESKDDLEHIGEVLGRARKSVAQA